ncbi:MAG: acyl-CoA dehydrogenase family protein [Pseudomonadota bacterium]
MHKTMDETVGRRAAVRRIDDGPSETSPRRAGAFAGTNSYSSDPILGALVDAALDEESEEDLLALGAYWGSAEAHEVARIAWCNRPTIRRDDFDGRRIDQVELHPAAHALLNRSVAAGLLSSAWEEGEAAHQHRLRAAALFLAAGTERAHLTAASATHAAVAALAYAPDIEAEVFPLVASRRYDRRALPAEDKDGVLISLAISERERDGVRGGLGTRGELLTGDGIRIKGEKTFVCAPNADYLLTLVRTPEGPTAALVARHAPENADSFAVESIVSFGGMEAQAIATVRFFGAIGRTLGEPGRGVQVLRDVGTLLQLDAAVVCAGSLRSVLSRAGHVLRTHVSTGARPLLEDPLTMRLVADVALTSAAQTALALRAAGAFDRAFERDGDHAVARVLTPAARVFCEKSGIAAAAEMREVIGGIALPADNPAARAGADMTVFCQWVGSANQAAHELVALVARDGRVLDDALDELGADLGNQNSDLIDRTAALGREAVADPGLARAFADQLAMVGAASAMRQSLPRMVSDAFISARLRGGYTALHGALDGRFDAAALIDFIIPED